MSWQAFHEKYNELANTSPYIAGVKKPGRDIIRSQYYLYDSQILGLATGASASSNIETQADSDSVLTYISAGSRLNLTSELAYNSNILLQIVDQSSGKPFFNIPTLMPLVAGAGGFPFLLAAPRVLNPNTTLTVTATNRTGATQASIELVLHTTRLFYRD